MLGINDKSPLIFALIMKSHSFLNIPQEVIFELITLYSLICGLAVQKSHFLFYFPLPHISCLKYEILLLLNDLLDTHEVKMISGYSYLHGKIIIRSRYPIHWRVNLMKGFNEYH